jgi:hypothetical protein
MLFQLYCYLRPLHHALGHNIAEHPDQTILAVLLVLCFVAAVAADSYVEEFLQDYFLQMILLEYLNIFVKER